MNVTKSRSCSLEDREKQALALVQEASKCLNRIQSYDQFAFLSQEAKAKVFSVGDIVSVPKRTYTGINKPGGVGLITKLNPKDGTYNVKYTLGGTESHLPGHILSYYTENEPGRRKSRGRSSATRKPRARETNACAAVATKQKQTNRACSSTTEVRTIKDMLSSMENGRYIITHWVSGKPSASDPFPTSVDWDAIALDFGNLCERLLAENESSKNITERGSVYLEVDRVFLYGRELIHDYARKQRLLIAERKTQIEELEAQQANFATIRSGRGRVMKNKPSKNTFPVVVEVPSWPGRRETIHWHVLANKTRGFDVVAPREFAKQVAERHDNVSQNDRLFITLSVLAQLTEHRMQKRQTNKRQPPSVSGPGRPRLHKKRRPTDANESSGSDDGVQRPAQSTLRPDQAAQRVDIQDEQGVSVFTAVGS